MSKNKTVQGFVEDYKKEIANSLKKCSSKTIDILEKFSEKLNKKSAKFTDEDKYIFSVLSDKSDFLSLIRNQSFKSQLIKNTDLVEPVQNKQDVVLFKLNKINYKVSDFDKNKVSNVVVQNIEDFENERNLTDYVYFKRLCYKVLDKIPNSLSTEFGEEDLDILLLQGFGNSWEREIEKESFTHGYLSGGAEGGNCYGGQPEEFHVSAPDNYKETEFPQVIELLKRLSPNITFLEYKDLEKDLENLSESFEKEISEYYGNYSNYKLTEITFDNVYQAFQNNNIDLSLQNIQNGINYNNKKKRKNSP